MIIELHDNETGNTLVARVKGVELDYQAEMQVVETATDFPTVVKWILLDFEGVRCVWEREMPGTEIPRITGRSTRFEGEWEKTPHETTLPEPTAANN